MRQWIMISAGLMMLAVMGCGVLPMGDQPGTGGEASSKITSPADRDRSVSDADKHAGESVPRATQVENVSNNDTRSLSSFGHCVGHYAKEITYLPDQLPFEDDTVRFSGVYDDEARQWMSIGLCLAYAPQPQVDDVSGKCLLAAMKWYREEYPESARLAMPVAATACLPAYQP